MVDSTRVEKACLARPERIYPNLLKPLPGNATVAGDGKQTAIDGVDPDERLSPLQFL